MGKANLKSMMIVITAGILVLSGCESKGDSKLSKENQSTDTTQISKEKLDREDISRGKSQLPFQLYMEKYKEQMPEVSKWKSADGSYHYPMTRDEWNKLDSWEEKYAMCQIPEKILGELDTPALLNLVLECPVLSNITYHDSYYDGVRQLAKDLNGMYELGNRSDFYETVLLFYEKLKIPSQDKSNLNQQLPNNPKIDDYYSLLEDDALMDKVREDIQLENTVNFCLAILGGMTKNVKQDMLERAGQVLSSKFKEIEASDYSDGIMKREEVKNASWIDKKVSGNMKASGQSKRKALDKAKGN